MAYAVGVMSEKTPSNPRSQRFMAEFSFKGFAVLALTFGFISNFELILTYRVRRRSNVILVCVHTQLVQLSLLKRLNLPCWIVPAPSSKTGWSRTLQRRYIPDPTCDSCCYLLSSLVLLCCASDLSGFAFSFQPSASFLCLTTSSVFWVFVFSTMLALTLKYALILVLQGPHIILLLDPDSSHACPGATAGVGGDLV